MSINAGSVSVNVHGCQMGVKVHGQQVCLNVLGGRAQMEHVGWCKIHVNGGSKKSHCIKLLLMSGHGAGRGVTFAFYRFEPLTHVSDGINNGINNDNGINSH